jgi:hypothetical protein
VIRIVENRIDIIYITRFSCYDTNTLIIKKLEDHFIIITRPGTD